MMLYITAVSPMPSARAAVPAMTVPGLRRSERTAYRTSRASDVTLQVRERVGRARRRRLASPSSSSGPWSCASSRARAAPAPIFGARSANCASRCWATSSMTSASSCGWSCAGATRARMSACQSNRSLGITHPRDPVDGRHELLPALALRLERGAARGREAVEALAPLARFFHPAADDPAALFHAIEQGIERRDIEREHAVGARLDELLQLVAVSRLSLQERQDEELRAPFL